MPVRFDQTGQHDHAAPVDEYRTRCIEAATHRDDVAAAHMHIGIGNVAARRVHGHDKGVLDDELALPGQFSNGRCARYAGTGGQAKGAKCARGAKKFAAVYCARFCHLVSPQLTVAAFRLAQLPGGPPRSL